MRKGDASIATVIRQFWVHQRQYCSSVFADWAYAVEDRTQLL